MRDKNVQVVDFLVRKSYRHCESTVETRSTVREIIDPPR